MADAHHVPFGVFEAQRRVDDPQVSPDQLAAVIHSFGLSVRLRAQAAGHPRLSARDVIALVQSAALGGEFVLACTTREDALDRFADDPDVARRSIVAFNPATSTQTLERLACDRDSRVRVNAGLNGNLSTSTRARLALHDDNSRVRREAHWAMTTTQGRAVLDGARFAHANTEDWARDPAAESRVLAWGADNGTG